MKLVFQIAAGILLAGLIAWGVQVAAVGYMARQASDRIEAAKQQQIKKQQLIAKAEAVRRAHEQALKAELQRKQREAAELEARKRAAFNQWWQAPTWCGRATSIQEAARCSELKRSKRAEFEKLLAAGDVTSP